VGGRVEVAMPRVKNVYARFMFGLAVAALALSVVFFLPLAALAWYLERDRDALLALCLVAALPLAAALSGLLILVMERFSSEK